MRRLPALALTTALVVVSGARAAPADDAALHDAALNLAADHVRDALDRGANPNALSASARPMSPLDQVTHGLLLNRTPDAHQRAVAIVRLLFARGARLGYADRAILYFPISEGSTELVSLLLDHGASATERLDGFTPTELARKYGRQAVYDLLVDRGGVPVDERASAQLALVQAASKGDVAGMATALKRGASIDASGPDGKPALVAASMFPSFDEPQASAVAWLLDRGADPNVRGRSGIADIGGIPLHVFVLANNLNPAPQVDEVRRVRAETTLQRLIKSGARVSAMDDSGRTPLHVAARFDNVRAAEILIRAGARVMARDMKGKTPLDYAESAPMIRLLKKHGARE